MDVIDYKISTAIQVNYWIRQGYILYGNPFGLYIRKNGDDIPINEERFYQAMVKYAEKEKESE